MTMPDNDDLLQCPDCGATFRVDEATGEGLDMDFECPVCRGAVNWPTDALLSWDRSREVWF